MAVIHKLSLSLSHLQGVNTIFVKNGSTEDELAVSFYSNGSPFNIENYTLKLINKSKYTQAYKINGNTAYFTINAANNALDVSSGTNSGILVDGGWNLCEIELLNNSSQEKIKTQNFQIHCENLSAGRKYHDESGIYLTREDIEKLRSQKELELLLKVNQSDNGKFLRVVNGAWAAVLLTDVSEVGV